MSLIIYGAKKETPNSKWFIGEIETPYDDEQHKGSLEQTAHIMDKTIKMLPKELDGDVIFYVKGPGYFHQFELSCFVN